jgi:hypothetical protein
MLPHMHIDHDVVETTMQLRMQVKAEDRLAMLRRPSMTDISIGLVMPPGFAAVAAGSGTGTFF